MSHATFISRLPSELLDNVFHLTVAADVSIDTPVILSHVSSHWRTHAINNPSIWRRLFILLDNSIVKKRYIDRIDAFIQRSSPLPLYIIIDSHRAKVRRYPQSEPAIANTSDFDQLTELGPQILSSLVQAAPRWQILDVVTRFFQQAPFPANLELPLLERLIVRADESVSNKLVSAFLHAPRLRILEVPTEWSIQGHFEIPWSQIQHAEIVETDLVAYHEQLTRLETLYIRVSYPNTSPIVDLPTVLNVAIDQTNFSRVMEHFKLRNLVSLELRSTILDSGWLRSTAFITQYISMGHIGSSLRHLSTHFPSYDSSQLKQLLQEIPSLETLSLLCIWALDSTSFPETCQSFFRDLTPTRSYHLVPNLVKLILRGVPYLGDDFYAFVISRGPSLHVSVIFMAEYPSTPVHAPTLYMHQWALYSWLEIRPHLLELRNSKKISIHVKGETKMLVKWGGDLVDKVRESVQSNRTMPLVWFLSEDVPNYIWGENNWPSYVCVRRVISGRDRGTIMANISIADLEASRELAEKYKHIGSLEEVKLEAF